MKVTFLTCLSIAIVATSSYSQNITQNIKGTVFDDQSSIPLFGATIRILELEPAMGSVTDPDGNFVIEKVPVGRYDLQVTYVGYKSFISKEILVSSGKETVLNIGLTESVKNLKEVEIKAASSKDEPLNTMTTVSAKQVNMEEAGRYAGGFDDPARLVSSYAGVSSNIGNNAIAIRGNSPKGLLWRMEGVQIPNQNHFADYITLGGGAVTALSSQTMGTSDFFTGAFPAEYGNALSGVFDINMRTGNTDNREYTLQAGLVGIDVASEGPFRKGGRSSYLFNYRYSTLGLLSPILPEEMGILTYQDLSFKFNFPTKTGTFSVWGIGAYDLQKRDAVTDTSKWESEEDAEAISARLTMGAAGVSYKRILGSRTYIQSTMAATQNGIDWSQGRWEDPEMAVKNDIQDYRWRYTVLTNINHKFSAKHTNRTGLIYDWFWYDTRIRNADEYGDPLLTYADSRNQTGLLQVYSESKLSYSDDLSINVGLHSQLLTLNNSLSVEPRIGIQWVFLPRQTISFAYGLHSQVEKLELYLVEMDTPEGTTMPNKNLEMNKSHHFVAGYKLMINENTRFNAEPYCQLLYDIPVVPGSYISTINIDDVYDFNDPLVNEGKGRNIGLDLTLERYLNKGLYYLITASLFDSKYTDGDGIERNTRYNKGYVFNILAGKEWQMGHEKKNILGANVRFSYMGGDRIIPADQTSTIVEGTIVEDYNRAYEQKLPDAPILSLAASYRINKPRHSSTWSFQIINALGYKEFQEYEYDPVTESISMKTDMLIIPNISYKIEF